LPPECRSNGRLREHIGGVTEKKAPKQKILVEKRVFKPEVQELK